MPNTVSTETVALIAGGAGVLGGVLGALAGGVPDYLLQRGRSNARAKAGARLLRTDLAVAAGILGRAAIERVWDVGIVPRIEVWEEYRDTLALALGQDQWQQVERAVSRVRFQQVNMEPWHEPVPILLRAIWPRPTRLPLDRDTAQGASAVVAALREGYNALAELSGGPLADETFGRPANAKRQTWRTEPQRLMPWRRA